MAPRHLYVCCLSAPTSEGPNRGETTLKTRKCSNLLGSHTRPRGILKNWDFVLQMWVELEGFFAGCSPGSLQRLPERDETWALHRLQISGGSTAFIHKHYSHREKTTATWGDPRPHYHAHVFWISVFNRKLQKKSFRSAHRPFPQQTPFSPVRSTTLPGCGGSRRGRDDRGRWSARKRRWLLRTGGPLLGTSPKWPGTAQNTWLNVEEYVLRVSVYDGKRPAKVGQPLCKQASTYLERLLQAIRKYLGPKKSAALCTSFNTVKPASCPCPPANDGVFELHTTYVRPRVPTCLQHERACVLPTWDIGMRNAL